jgi:hypothetical protein
MARALLGPTAISEAFEKVVKGYEEFADAFATHIWDRLRKREKRWSKKWQAKLAGVRQLWEGE